MAGGLELGQGLTEQLYEAKLDDERVDARTDVAVARLAREDDGRLELDDLGHLLHHAVLDAAAH